MTKATFNSVSEYIAAKPKDVQGVLKLVRDAIRKAVPDAEEAISYHMPVYKLNGDLVLYFAGWKEHYSLYPAGDAVASSFKKELARYEIRKGTIRFPLSEPVPVKLIERIAKFRAQHLMAHPKRDPHSRSLEISSRKLKGALQRGAKGGRPDRA